MRKMKIGPWTIIEYIVYIRAKVRRVSPWTAQYRIALHSDCGRLIALVSKSRFTELDLREGEGVFAAFSCAAVHAVRTGGLMKKDQQ